MEALPDTFTPALITTTVTQHTGDYPHIEVYEPIPEIAAGPDHAHHSKPSKNTSSKLLIQFQQKNSKTPG